MKAYWRGEGTQHRGGRPYQEDSWTLRLLADGTLLAIVADGMGGHVGGAVASKLVVDAVAGTVEGGGTLVEGLEAGNEAVRRGSQGKPELEGMGSTLLAALVKDEEVRWVSVGDSPFYLVSGDGLVRLNADHSMAPQIDALLARGMLTAEEAAAHPGRHTLREAVMGAPLKLIDEGHRRVGAGTRLLLCSDGVQTLDDKTIASCARGAVQTLIDRALAAGAIHQDNITVVKLERVS